MEKDLLQLQIALQFLEGIGIRRARIMASQYSQDLSKLFTDSCAHIHQRTGISLPLLKRMNRKKALEKALPYAQQIARQSANCLFITDANYPRRLRHCEDAPLLLFLMGDIDLNALYSAAVVGTRKPSTYGLKVTEDIVVGLSSYQPLIVSGMAYGVDIAAHKMCVERGVPTLGVLGHGLDRLYPSVHKHIARKMLNNGGLLTEFLPGTAPDRENFPKRNRIVAGMTDATIVVESKKSGGSLNTARLANDYHKDVFAVPGSLYSETSEGCNELIAKQGALLFAGVPDFIETMGWKQPNYAEVPEPPLAHFEKPVHQKIMSLLHAQTSHFDSIVQQTQLAQSDVSTALFELEMMGVIRAMPGMNYGLMR